MNFIKYILLFVLQFFLFIVCFAQKEKYRAVLWGTDEGLSWAGGNFMIKDKNGFLWISSVFGGLNRFDGNSFKKYPGEGSDRGNIGTGYTAYGLIEDSLHNIWIGTNEGISRYDINADTFTNFKITPDTVLVTPNSFPVWATKNEVFVIHIHSKTIYAFNIHSLTKRTLLKLAAGDTVCFNPERSIVYIEKTQRLWMMEGTEDKPGGGLLSISLSTGKRDHYTWRPCFKKITNHSHVPLCMCFDQKRNCLWLDTKDGLMQFTLDDKLFHHIDACNEWVNLKDYNSYTVNGIALDLFDRVWVSTSPKGIFIYDPSNESVSFPFSDSVNPKNIPTVIQSIYCDRDGMIWLAFENRGVYQLIPSSPVVTHYDSRIFSFKDIKENWVQNFLPAAHGKIWVGGWPGLYAFDPSTGDTTLVRKSYKPGVHLDSNFPMMIDTLHNKAWIGVEPWGIYELDMLTLKYWPLVFKDINNHIITAGRISYNNIRPFKNGFLFVINGQGIFYVNKDSLVAQQIFAITPDIYVATAVQDKYLFLFCSRPLDRFTYSYKNGRWIKISNPFDSLGWYNIYYNNSDQTYWVGTDKELMHYNSNFQKLGSYTAKDGLPYQAWASIASDNAGNIWLSNPLGVIAELNTKSGQVATLSEKDGYKKNFFGVAPPFLKDGIGDLYFAGGEGIDRVRPDKFKSSPPSSVYFQSLEVNQLPVLLSTSINNLQELSLKYFQNEISIGTGIIDFYSNGKSRIRYKLQKDGKSVDWQYAPDYYTIRYEGLQPGKYTLVIQASNSTNEFNGPEKVLQINISAAFWDTWWFRLAIVVIASYIIITIVRARIKKIKRDAFIENQLKELEMKALKAQMNPHFIYNALNSIQALVANDKKAEGIHYIGSFSRLLRQVLENSENNVISLDKELETIGLYIQLEALRLDMQLQYKKILPKEIVAEFEKIPPLILQPFVENALWHGLSRKEGEKEIIITIDTKDGWLICDITDNGIGRLKAQEWKSHSVVLHESKAIDITTKRLIDFNEDSSVSPIDFFDLYDDKRNPSGTRVSIHIKRRSSFSSV